MGQCRASVLLAVAAFPAFVASMVPEDELIDKIIVPFCECTDASIRGCWGITEPDHGSDTLLPGYPSFCDPTIGANCRITSDGDSWIVNGQKSSWVSGGTIATHCALYCQVDPTAGHAGGGIFVVPLDLPGVSKGKPLNKLGQRDLNQGEIFFDNVRIPKSFMIAPPEAYESMLEITLSTTTALMGVLGAGIARAAFDEALTVCQGTGSRRKAAYRIHTREDDPVSHAEKSRNQPPDEPGLLSIQPKYIDSG